MDSEPLHIQVTSHDGVSNVHVAGEIDMDSVGALSTTFEELIDEGRITVRVDAADISFIDSSGLRVILAAERRLTELGGRLTIDRMSGAVSRVLELTGLIDRYRSTDGESVGTAFEAAPID
jgi:anti-sigma B factor antagonist